MATVSWSTTIQVAGGPTVSVSEGPFLAEAIDRIEVIVSADEKDRKVDLQPGPVSGILLLLINSDQYGDVKDTKKSITFKVSDDSSDSKPIKLSGPQFYSGDTVLLLEKEPRSLKFTNNTPDPAKIEIFIARDATP